MLSAATSRPRREVNAFENAVSTARDQATLVTTSNTAAITATSAGPNERVTAIPRLGPSAPSMVAAGPTPTRPAASNPGTSWRGRNGNSAKRCGSSVSSEENVNAGNTSQPPHTAAKT